MNDPFDQSFADRLRASDRTVDFRPDEVVSQIKMRRQNIQQTQRRLVTACVGLVCLAGLAGFMSNAWDQSAPPQHISKEQSQLVDQQDERTPGQLASELEYMKQSEQRLRCLIQELAELRKQQADQDQVLLQEVVSRTQLKPSSLSAFRY